MDAKRMTLHPTGLRHRELLVTQFHAAMRQTVGAKVELNPALMNLRMRLLNEEVEELKAAAKDVRDNPFSEGARAFRAELLKELADVAYCVSGLAVTFGLDLATAFERVHASNMSKLGDDGRPLYRDDGKVLKGPNYQPPFLEDLV